MEDEVKIVFSSDPNDNKVQMHLIGVDLDEDAVVGEEGHKVPLEQRYALAVMIVLKRNSELVQQLVSAMSRPNSAARFNVSDYLN